MRRLKLPGLQRPRRAAEGQRFRRRLVTHHQFSPARTLARRLAVVVALLIAVLALFWFDRDGLVDHHDGDVSFSDVLYFTLVTVTTVGYGDIVPVSDRARLIDAILVTPIRLFLILVFVGTAYQLVIQRALEDFRMARLQASLVNHIVICGFGLTGRFAARELIARGTPPGSIVAIDPSEAALEDAATLGLIGLRGDAIDRTVLEDAAVARARAVVVSTGIDDSSILVCLTTKSIAPDANIIAINEDVQRAGLVRQSGANIVISPRALGGSVLADTIHNPAVARVLVDLLSAEGQLVWSEREASADEVGRHPRDVAESVVLAIRRAGRLLWPWTPDASRIAAGDRLVIMCAGQRSGEAPAAITPSSGFLDRS